METLWSNPETSLILFALPAGAAFFVLWRKQESRRAEMLALILSIEAFLMVIVAAIFVQSSALEWSLNWVAMLALWACAKNTAARENFSKQALIGDLQAQLEASNAVMHVQGHALYDQACQLHGKAAVDRAMRAAHERGTN
jgi:hypothetical protein